MGRQLDLFDGISYTYNEDGIRTSKTSNGVTTKYYLNGTNIIEQTDGTNTLHFYYDSSNELIGFNYAENDYFYVKNKQDDITDITDSNGEVVASYQYDHWGKILSVNGDETIGNLNPFRYRGYYYDNDIQMYYLQSRYYDPEVGRFINCDDVNYIGLTESEVSYNPFAYCENDPVNTLDEDGNLSWRLKIAIVAGLAYGIYNTGFWYGVNLKAKRTWVILGYRFAKGFVRGFSGVYFFGKNKTTLAAIAVGLISVIDGMFEGNVKSPSTALSKFINGYTATTSVAVGQKLFKRIGNKKIKDAFSKVWEIIFG